MVLVNSSTNSSESEMGMGLPTSLLSPPPLVLPPASPNSSSGTPGTVGRWAGLLGFGFGLGATLGRGGGATATAGRCGLAVTAGRCGLGFAAGGAGRLASALILLMVF